MRASRQGVIGQDEAITKTEELLSGGRINKKIYDFMLLKIKGQTFGEFIRI